jgi:hypothetical protein
MTTKLKQSKSTLQPESVENLTDLSKKFNLIKNVALDIYGQKQMMYMMKSNFFEQALVNSKFSIKDFVKAGHEDSTMTDRYDSVMSRA